MNRRDVLRTLGLAGAAAVVRCSRVPVAPGGASADTLASQLAASIQRHKVPGASVALFRNGAWDVAAAGIANVATGVDVTPDTVMHIGSITKVLNATLVMQLVDEGRVALDAPLKRYLSDFQLADREAAERITVGMLLNHTSGIDGEWFPDTGPDTQRIEAIVAHIAQQGQLYAPGAELSYCNAAAVLAGYLVQRLLDKSWYSVVEERIFTPLDMQHSLVAPANLSRHAVSVGHFLQQDGTNKTASVPFLNPGFAPAGTTAMLSATDLATFALTHINDGVGPNGRRLLSAASARRMRQQSAAWRGVGGAGFGLGWMTIDKTVVGHDGGGPGVAAWLYADPSTKTVAAVLTNAAHGGRVVGDITAPLYQASGAKAFQADALELEKQATTTKVDPAAYVGEYENVALIFRVIPYEDGIAVRERAKMRLYETDSLEESPPDPLKPMGDGHFTSARRFVTFLNPDAGGRMQHLASRLRLYKRR